MFKVARRFFSEHLSIAILAGLIAGIILIGTTISAFTFSRTLKETGLIDRSICWSDGCVKELVDQIPNTLGILKTTMDVSVAIATAGGIFVALLSYFTTASNTALTNHIEHLKVFNEYLESEIRKREKLSSQQIDALLLYNVIFDQSRFGKTSVSESYKVFVKKLNEIIQESNERCVIGTPGGFNYKDHQRKVKELLESAGITVYMAPRNDYFEMEDQLFSLLHRISQSFCPPNILESIGKRSYY